ncbi:MAG TPA: AI-2E family transporter [Coprothermobacter sp.]|jgi:predicted PurR-regulated permease PerM|nr:AI-2E family transporter [Coprothermobacter sp.]
MDRKNLMRVILQGEAAFLLMAFAFYLVVRNLSTIYGWIVFLAWLTFAMYVVEAAAKLFKVQKRFSALVGVITAILLLIGLGISIFYLIQSIIPPLTRSIDNLVTYLPKLQETVGEWAQRSDVLTRVLNEISSELQSLVGAETVKNVLLSVGRFVTQSGGSLFQITLAVLVSGLLIPYKDKLVNFADRKLPAAKFKQLDLMLGQYALQRLVSGFALGVVLFIGNIIILRNVGLALGIASLAFVLDFIPYVGPFFAFIINAVVVLVVSPKWLSLLFSLVIFLTGQGVEQLVAATMASVQFSIPFIVAIALVIFGGVVAGVPGLILGVPIGAYLINLWSKSKEI